MTSIANPSSPWNGNELRQRCRSRPVELRACDGSAPSQKFLPRADGTIHNPVSGRCLDLGNADTTPGRQLWLWDCSGSAAQRWSVPVLGTAPLPVPVP
ncbi:ricin-type beta-trefoil lectin domain protein [Streptomyces erythrochromogenes]|uniref:ricin-type beta-trefoil lectin domain protein n=1 Tax=Streptomyces erythrochromogenes TaxID=285574 RepID=UPI0036380688